MPPTSSYWIDRLRLIPSPGGGYVRETWRGSALLRSAARAARRRDATGTPGTAAADASGAATAAYVLLESNQRMHLRRLLADEIWNFYSGSPLILTVLHPDGALDRIVLGDDPTEGEQYQAGIPAGCWLGAEVMAPGSYALAGRVFEADDAEATEPGTDIPEPAATGGEKLREYLLHRFPQHAALIGYFTSDEEG